MTAPTSITSDSFIGTYNGGHNGEHFVLNGSNINSTLYGLSSTITYMDGSHDSELLNACGSATVNMPGQGGYESLTVADLTGAVRVYGFNATDSFTQMFASTASVVASMHSDGHGGTLIGHVDFVGDKVGASQVHGVIPV